MAEWSTNLIFTKVCPNAVVLCRNNNTVYFVSLKQHERPVRMTFSTTVAYCAVMLATTFSASSTAETQPANTGKNVTLQVFSDNDQIDSSEPARFTSHFTSKSLQMLLKNRTDLLPLPFHLQGQQQTFLDALQRINMGQLIKALEPVLNEQFPKRFNRKRDLIQVPVPEEKQVTIKKPELEQEGYTGPKFLVTGFLLQNITEQEFVQVAVRVMQTARQLLDSGNPLCDQTRPDFYRLLAEQRVEQLTQELAQRKKQAQQKKQIRKEIGQALGIYDPKTDTFKGQGDWRKETRRFSYIVQQDGQFIERLKPIVTQINHKLEIAGFTPPQDMDLAKPGIHFDADLKDVEIVLPKPVMSTFLEEADALEQRMAEEHMISIEAVRLTNRDIVDGAIASRLNVKSQGVHDIQRYDPKEVVRELGINSLVAVANQQLQLRALRSIQSGQWPTGVDPVQIGTPQMPSPQIQPSNTTVGSTFSLGADDIFFDGREQSYGFSYISPDGIEHIISFEVVDSLREFWDRIERNLIVHKIKKTEGKTNFKVPVGPDTLTFEGIAALISQDDQQLVVATGTGAISEISATAGTWLVIQDFQINPIPGSSTTLLEEEKKTIEDKVLLTMFLRCPNVSPEIKRELLASSSRKQLRQLFDKYFQNYQAQQVRSGRAAKTLGDIFESRRKIAIEDAAVIKKEKNSFITLSFYSSQGNIIQQPGTTQLGSANDLTSFTTQLRPNHVTPISSFFTKSGSGAKGSSPLTGVAKGEQTNKEKTMTHLVIRARFPTIERERQDRQEGRHLGYFELPMNRQPPSNVDLPFLSSSEHPLERLSKLRIGLMFGALQEDRVREPLELINPNSLTGKVPRNVFETATTRLLMNRKIISDSPGSDARLTPEYRKRFVTEVRSLLEFDKDFFEAPNTALRNMQQWNTPQRIILALNNCPDKFALQRLIEMLDELGQQLIPDEYAENYLAVSPPALFNHKIYPLSHQQLRTLRRDVASHYMRIHEIYGDAFLEAVSTIFNLGTYQPKDLAQLHEGPFRGYHNLVVFDRGGNTMANEDLYVETHEQFLLLKEGGRKGKLFEPSFETIEDMPAECRQLVSRGKEILEHKN